MFKLYINPDAGLYVHKEVDCNNREMKRALREGMDHSVAIFDCFKTNMIDIMIAMRIESGVDRPGLIYYIDEDPSNIEEALRV